MLITTELLVNKQSSASANICQDAGATLHNDIKSRYGIFRCLFFEIILHINVVSVIIVFHVKFRGKIYE